MSDTDTIAANGEAVATVTASRYRRGVLRELVTDGPGTPSELAERVGWDVEHPLPRVSRALKNLRDVDCVRLLVPEETVRGRVYGATDSGEAVWMVVGDG